MKNPLKILVAIGVAVLVFLAVIVSRPCGYTRLVVMNGTGKEYGVTIHDNRGNLLWETESAWSAPVRTRAYIAGDTSYTIEIVDRATGERRSMSAGYDFPDAARTNLFFIRHEDIVFHDWYPENFARYAATACADRLSCADAFVLQRVSGLFGHDK